MYSDKETRAIQTIDEYEKLERFTDSLIEDIALMSDEELDQLGLISEGDKAAREQFLEKLKVRGTFVPGLRQTADDGHMPEQFNPFVQKNVAAHRFVGHLSIDWFRLAVISICGWFVFALSYRRCVGQLRRAMDRPKVITQGSLALMLCVAVIIGSTLAFSGPILRSGDAIIKHVSTALRHKFMPTTPTSSDYYVPPPMASGAFSATSLLTGLPIHDSISTQPAEGFSFDLSNEDHLERIVGKMGAAIDALRRIDSPSSNDRKNLDMIIGTQKVFLTYLKSGKHSLVSNEVRSPSSSWITSKSSGVVLFADSSATIILHAGSFFAIYEYSSEPVVKAGDVIQRGQKIAMVGQMAVEGGGGYRVMHLTSGEEVTTVVQGQRHDGVIASSLSARDLTASEPRSLTGAGATMLLNKFKAE